MHKLVFASLGVVCAAQLSDSEIEFQKFQVQYNKAYSSDAERAARFKVFEANRAIAEQRNRLNIANGGTAVHGVTKFSDLTPEEFRAAYLSSLPQAKASTSATSASGGSVGGGGFVDWRTKLAVTPVEDEGQCGSTWAFSIKEAIESFAFINNIIPLTKLSVQQIVSCDTTDFGCNGGMPDTGYAYIEKAGGLESDADYPYTSGTGRVDKCKFDKSKIVVGIKNATFVDKGEKNLHDTVDLGPPSACVAANDWQTYTGGILQSCTGDMNHCGQVVGYDDTNSPPYWIVRNQWGTDWGEKGYIYIKQGGDLCLIADLVSYPTF